MKYSRTVSCWNVTRFSVLLSILLSIIACQTPLKIAGNQHKVVATKWHALAKYAESKIVNYGVTITASFDVESIDKKPAFKLNNIKFSARETPLNINLLAPRFEHKYICLPLCFQLLEYVSIDGEDSATMLAKFFSAHEFELFQFYGDLVILSERLADLAETDRGLLKAYLLSLANKEKGFATTKEFIVFWEQALADENFQQFLDDPIVMTSDFLQQFQVAPNTLWASAKESSSIEYETTENSGQEQISPQAFWLSATQATPEIGLFRYNQELEDVLSWQDARTIAITVGEHICSYDNNLFGLVTDVSGAGVDVKVLGKAITLKDGVVQELGAGSLFKSNPNLFFIPMLEQQRFSTGQVATCYIE